MRSLTMKYACVLWVGMALGCAPAAGDDAGADASLRDVPGDAMRDDVVHDGGGEDAAADVAADAAEAGPDRVELDVTFTFDAGGEAVSVGPRAISSLERPDMPTEPCDVALRNGWDPASDNVAWVRLETCPDEPRAIPGGQVNGFDLRLPVPVTERLGAFTGTLGPTQVRGAFDGVESFWAYGGTAAVVITAWSRVGGQITVEGTLDGELLLNCSGVAQCEQMGATARVSGTFTIVVTP